MPFIGVNVTDYERVSLVSSDAQTGQFKCPRCAGVCIENKSQERPSKKARQWDCSKCGRGWDQVPSWCRTVSDANKAFEQMENE